MAQYAVITGDVNSSSRMSRKHLKSLERILWNCFRELQTHLPEISACHFTCFRGDSWQFVVKEPDKAAVAAVFFRASLLIQGRTETGFRLNASTAIGFGTIDFFPDAESSAGGGRAYELSGKNLDSIRKRVPGMRACGLEPQDSAITAMLGLIDVLIRRWTIPQARAVQSALMQRTQSETALSWKPEPISQQAVHKHLLNAGWPAVEPALHWMSTTVRDCIDDNNHILRTELT